MRAVVTKIYKEFDMPPKSLNKFFAPRITLYNLHNPFSINVRKVDSVYNDDGTPSHIDQIYGAYYHMQ